MSDLRLLSWQGNRVYDNVILVGCKNRRENSIQTLYEFLSSHYNWRCINIKILEVVIFCGFRKHWHCWCIGPRCRYTFCEHHFTNQYTYVFKDVVSFHRQYRSHLFSCFTDYSKVNMPGNCSLADLNSLSLNVKCATFYHIIPSYRCHVIFKQNDIIVCLQFAAFDITILACISCCILVPCVELNCVLYMHWN